MNSRNILTVYILAIIGGILLIILNGRASLLEGIVIVIGVLFLVVCGVMLLQIILSLLHKEKSVSDTMIPVAGQSGDIEHAPSNDQLSSMKRTQRRMRTMMLIPVGGGILFGILLVSAPGFFVRYLIYTFGLVMILCGLVQLIFTLPGMRWMNVNRWWLVPPIAIMLVGVTVFILGPEGVEKAIILLTGIVLTVYGIEGLIGWVHRQSRLRQMEMLTRK